MSALCRGVTAHRPCPMQTPLALREKNAILIIHCRLWCEICVYRLLPSARDRERSELFAEHCWGGAMAHGRQEESSLSIQAFPVISTGQAACSSEEENSTFFKTPFSRHYTKIRHQVLAACLTWVPKYTKVKIYKYKTLWLSPLWMQTNYWTVFWKPNRIRVLKYQIMEYSTPN